MSVGESYAVETTVAKARYLNDLRNYPGFFEQGCDSSRIRIPVLGGRDENALGSVTLEVDVNRLLEVGEIISLIRLARNLPTPTLQNLALWMFILDRHPGVSPGYPFDRRAMERAVSAIFDDLEGTVRS